MKMRDKTLRQYRSDKEASKKYTSGLSFEDRLLQAPQHQAQAEQSLWRAVILQMMTAALSNSHKRDQQRFKRDAWHWLTTHSRDFRMVCDYAGYDPVWLQHQINQFLSNHQNPFTKAEQRREALDQFSLRFGLLASRHNATSHESLGA